MGHSSGDHVFKEDGKVLWEKDLPFTLYYSKILDDGTIVGYAYDRGFMGFQGNAGNFYFVIINKSGEFRLKEEVKRVSSSYMHTDPRPLIRGLYVDHDKDRIVLEVYDAEYDEKVAGWTYQLSTGKKLETISPEKLADSGSEIAQWIIKEKEREKVHEESLNKPQDNIKEVDFKLHLDYLGAKDLNQGKNEEPLSKERIDSLVIDPQGRFAYINYPLNGKLEFILLTPDGEMIKRLPIIEIKQSSETSYTHNFSFLSGDKFIFILSEYKSQKTEAWIIDASQGSLIPLENFECPRVEAVAGHADGFYVLTNFRSEFTGGYTPIDELRSYTLDGQLNWSIKDAYGDENGIFSAEDIALNASGQIVVLENIGKKVKIFDANGGLVKKIDLKKQWGREPIYPTSITVLPSGEFIVSDAIASGGSYVHMDSEGKIIKELSLKRDNGAVLSVGERIQSSPDGKLWASDGQLLMQFGYDGVLKNVIGAQPEQDLVNRIDGAVMDAQGNLYVFDGETNGIHRFKKDVRKDKLFNMKPSDSCPVSYNAEMTISGEGYLYLSGDAYFRETCPKKGYRKFSLGGKYMGIEKDIYECEGITSFQKGMPNYVPGSNRLWVQCLDQIKLIDEKGKVIKHIDRMPDENWLDFIAQISVGRDGSAWVSSGGFGSNEELLSLYDRQGEPILTMKYPPIATGSKIEYNGELLALLSYDSKLYIWDRSGLMLGHWDLSGELSTNRGVYHFISEDGRSLIILDAFNKKLHSYKLTKI